MPVYDFKNKETGEVVELIMSYNDKVKYLEENPNMESYHGNMGGVGLIDPVRLGVRKVPEGFKQVLKNIHARAPGSRLDKFADV